MGLTLTRQTDYALQFLHALSRLPDGVHVSLRTYARRARLSFLFLQRIVAKLRTAGLIHAIGGRTGGYALARPSAHISVREVAAAIEGDSGIVPCLIKGASACPHKGVCATRTNFHTINAHIQRYLESISIADL